MHQELGECAEDTERLRSVIEESHARMEDNGQNSTENQWPKLDEELECRVSFSFLLI